ncbi:NADPH-dependent F420 reductase [Arthrobacter sp. B0490]|uniref:NADPH-dependent F420 reductase n=1 Tax=Arthrobacter sp. B0490 TaxID=2058891 RepID=UPI000CE311AA|nr:NAD(P)-binding domain-containing protein [Arthrobacter sp. B0490]
MRIGILGAGSIGKTLAIKLAGAGHEVRIANSRGPESIGADVLSTGARAVDASEVVSDIDVLIISIPLNAIPGVADLIRSAPSDAVIIDTSNYYPLRDQKVDALEAGQVESVWVSEQLQRPIAKAWNAITSQSFESEGRQAGAPDRIAIPVAADRDIDRTVAMDLVDQTGFDAFFSGSLADSWRQQPGTPAYCTDRTSKELSAALDAANSSVSGDRRDFVNRALLERLDNDLPITREYIVNLNRKIYI